MVETSSKGGLLRSSEAVAAAWVVAEVIIETSDSCNEGSLVSDAEGSVKM